MRKRLVVQVSPLEMQNPLSSAIYVSACCCMYALKSHNVSLLARDYVIFGYHDIVVEMSVSIADK